jgi:hypothetical protein
MGEEQTPIPSKEDIQEAPSDAQSLIDKANAAAARIEEANRRTEELILRAEEVKVRRQLEGRSNGGDVEEEEEETPSAYAKRVMSNKS